MAALLLASTLVSGAAGAQTDEQLSGARAAATAGAQAFQNGEYAKAVDFFSRAEKLVHAPTHLLFLARAHAKLGQLVDAREIYIKIKREQLAADAPQAFKDAQQSAAQELQALAPRIPRVTASVQGAGAKTPSITMDGRRVPDALVGIPRPVDPGKHVFKAVADGMESPEQTVDVKEGANESVVLTLQPVQGAAASKPAPAQPAGPAPVSDTGKDTGGVSGMRIGAYAGFGVGAIGIAGGVVFLLKKSSNSSDADKLFNSCNPQGCTSAQRSKVKSLDSDASSAGTLSTVGFVVGGVGVATGVVLLVLDSGKKRAAAVLRHGDLTVRPLVGYRSVGVGGTF